MTKARQERRGCAQIAVGRDGWPLTIQPYGSEDGRP